MVRRRKRVEGSVGVYHDSQRRTCLLVENGDQAKFIPLDIADGFQVHETTLASFEQRYTLMSGYPVGKAARLYLNYALAVGATDEAIDYLAQIIPVTDEDRNMAISKREAPPKKAAKPEEKPARKRRAKKAEPTLTKPRVRKPRKKSESNEYASAAQMFQGLIMEGALTDSEIFAQVQEAFGLDDKKRSYVTWYRNNLKKKGENPPEAK